mmetsp:Transcript_34311/g.60048  ORF Transcript_34311/g.60048 Transcript_34311/m.60048 type:complete len:375 (+) Transcript_34311:329-1453(+)
MGGSCGVSKKNLDHVQLPERSVESAYGIGKYFLPADTSPKGFERLKEWKEMLGTAQVERAAFAKLLDTPYGLLQLQGRVWEGVPPHYRWWSWLALKNLLYTDSNRYTTLVLGPSDSVVYKDINRTFPEHPYFQNVKSGAQAALSRILSKYEAAHPQVGYCQGMNYVAGLLLMVSGGDECETYEMFCSILEKNLCQMYTEGMPYLSKVNYAFDLLFAQALPDLHAHLHQQGVPQELWITKWFLTLFALNLPMAVTVRLWDHLLVRGELALHLIAIGILEHLRPTLMQLDIGGIAMAFNTLTESCPSADQLFELADNHKITPNQLAQAMQMTQPTVETLKSLDIVIDSTEGEGLVERLESLTSAKLRDLSDLIKLK